MGAIDTIAAYQGTVASTLAAGVMATGDSATVRNFPNTAKAQIVAAFYDDVTSPLPARIRSPLLHDNVDGIEFDPGTSAPSELLPPYACQQLQPQDQLTFELSTAASTGKALLAAMVYYSQLPGAAARLFGLGDIQGLVKSIKPLRVSVGSGANTAGQWYDLPITTTENLLHANTDYAVLGITCTAAVAAVGIKGTDTGNLRVCAPGGTNNPYAPEYFVRLANDSGMPTIPVINSANAGSTFISIISSAATGATSVVSVILAELTQPLSASS
jgi:hypothetical protein